MQITFSIEYYAPEGETLYLICPEIEPGITAMIPGRSGKWSVSAELPDRLNRIRYRYRLCDSDGNSLREEWGADRERLFRNGTERVFISDMWHDRSKDSPLFSTAFTDCIYSRGITTESATPLNRGIHRIEINAPEITPDQAVAICGNCQILGDWDPAKAPTMEARQFPKWSIDLPLKDIPDELEYKFIVRESHSGHLIKWEDGKNRRFVKPAGCDAAINSAGRLNAVYTAPKESGTSIPVFSIRTEKDCGCGDFLSLLPLIDWAAETGQHFIQILPINDTTMTHTKADSYPYNAISTFALHPMYLRLEELGDIDNDTLKHIHDDADRLNKRDYVDYESVNATKDRYARLIYRAIGEKTLVSKEFKDFFNANSHWLKPYAAYCIKRELCGTTELSQWGDLATYTPDKAEQLLLENRDEANYVYYIQYHLHRQLKYASEYARNRGVALKGDIPIGISRNSVDAWLYPELFNLDFTAGAPPDDFSVLGQNWGFPTYNWERMSENGFAWWKSRFRKMAEYFAAYRIDHLLGFFRIWQIPRSSVRGMLGTFYPALPFTIEEVADRYGFRLEPDTHCRPKITEELIEELFGTEKKMVISSFLTSDGCGSFKLKQEYDTQAKIQSKFNALPKTEVNALLQDGLYRLTENVLFIEDSRISGMYHPRIAGRDTEQYARLDAEQKRSYDTLYEDFYYHRHNNFWRQSALWKLPPLIDSTNMLVCAEDLGMIPGCVPEVMSRLNLLSLEVQRMPKGFGERFADPSRYPYLSVCTTSTHDMGGLRQWWLGLNDNERDSYIHEMLGERDNAPKEDTPGLCKKILSRHMTSRSMLCILPLQDWLSMSGELRRANPSEEQINDPSNPHHYWKYRMHRTIESIASDRTFTASVQSLTSSRQMPK